MKGFQLSLPLMPATIDELYIDQAPTCDDIYDRRIECFYTPGGIKEMDSSFCRRIMNCAENPEVLRAKILNRREEVRKWRLDQKQNVPEEIKTRAGVIVFHSQMDREIKRLEERIEEELRYVGEDPEKLKDEILCNPHLHPCIKENLLDNLERILRDKLTEA